MMDYYGNTSGRDINKREKLGFTKEETLKVKVPLVKEFLFICNLIGNRNLST